MKKILIPVDYTDDFANPNGALSVPNADVIAPNIQKRINDPIYDAIIYTFDTHTAEDYEGSEEQKAFPTIHCEFGTPGWNFYKIKPRYESWDEFIESRKEPFGMFSSANEYFFTKNVFDIWTGNETFSTWFDDTFSPDEYEVDVVGVATNYCVYMAVMGLVQRGYKVNIIEDCVEGIRTFPNGDEDPSYKQNITIMKNRGVNFI